MKREEQQDRNSRAALAGQLLTKECPLNEATTKLSLSDSRRRLVELMQQLNFGRIEDLTVRAGEPIFDPAPKVIQKLKIGGENGPRPELSCDDFLLKKQTIELLEAISNLGDGTVLILDVKHGLPFAVEIEFAARLNRARGVRA